MRILYLNSCARMGGAETSLLELLRSVRRSQPEWHLGLLLGEDGPLRHYAEELGIAVQVLPFPPGLADAGDSALRLQHGWGRARALGKLIGAAILGATYRRRLSHAIASGNWDVVHSTGFKMHVLSAGACGASPLIWHMHDYLAPRPAMRRCLRVLRRHCAEAIANSESVADQVRTCCDVHRVQTIQNAVDLQRFCPNGRKADLDRLAGLPERPGAVRVGLIATFARWKGHLSFLRAVANLGPESNVRAYIIGGPIYQTSGSQHTQQELEEEVDRLGLHGRVGFTGYLAEPADAMRFLDIIVHASTEPEPFGMVIAEGLACGKPVIAAVPSGATELLGESDGVLTHPAGDSLVLSRQIEHLAANPEIRTLMGRLGRESALHWFRSERLAERVGEVYQRLVSVEAPGLAPAGEHR